MGEGKLVLGCVVRLAVIDDLCLAASNIRQAKQPHSNYPDNHVLKHQE